LDVIFLKKPLKAPDGAAWIEGVYKQGLRGDEFSWEGGFFAPSVAAFQLWIFIRFFKALKSTWNGLFHHHRLLKRRSILLFSHSSIFANVHVQNR